MIGRLQGILLEKQPPEILLNVQGVKAMNCFCL